EHRVQRDKERSRTPRLTPRGRSAPLAKLCSYSHYSRSQHSRYWSTNKVEDESSRYDPQQPVDFTTTLTHRVDHGPRDETNTDAAGDGIGQWHGDQGKKNGQTCPQDGQINSANQGEHP